MFGFPWGRVCFHRRLCSRHRSSWEPKPSSRDPSELQCSATCSAAAPCCCHLSPEAAPSISPVEVSPPGRGFAGNLRGISAERWEGQPGAGTSCCSQGWALWSIHFQVVDSSDIQGQLPAAGIIPNLCWLRAAHQEFHWKRGIHSPLQGCVWGCGISLQGFYLPIPVRLNTRSP